MARPVLDDLELQQVQLVAVHKDQVLHRHDVAALEGDFFQRLGRRATSVSLTGVLTGAEAGEALKQLRTKFRAAEPVSFAADITTATRVDSVLIEELRVRELAGRPERFAYEIKIREFIEPPAPVTEEPPPAPPEEPVEPRIDRDVATLVAEVTAAGAPDLDPTQSTVTATRLPAGSGITRVLSNRTGATWTDTELPAGDYSVEATVTDPRAATGSATATIQAAQTTQVSIPLGPAAVVAQLFVVHFWFDKAFVEPCQRAVLREVRDYAAAHTGERLVIVGHTDKTGPPRYNQSLSERRARAVHAHLTFGRDAAARTAALAELEAIRQPRPAAVVDTVADTWDLREAQHMLQDLNFYPGRVDGTDGPLTQEAIRAFRCQNGLLPGTTMDDTVWAKLIENYLAQDGFGIPVAQFMTNCGTDPLRWLGCGEDDPVVNVPQAERRNRRVELLFVRATTLPCSVPEPVTYDMPTVGAGGAGWCLNPANATDRCCFINKAVRPCSGAAPGQWCRPPAAPTFTVKVTVQREVRQPDGTVAVQPFPNARIVLIDPKGKIEGSEDGRGAPVPMRVRANGTVEFRDRSPGVYTLEVREGLLIRRVDQTDGDVRGDTVCRTSRSASDEIQVVAIDAPIMREIRLPTTAHVLRALQPGTRDPRTCAPTSGTGPRLAQASALSDADVRAAFDGANSILRQIRVRADPVDIVREAYTHPAIAVCEIDANEFGLTLLALCAYDGFLNVFFVGDLAGAGEAGFSISPESALRQSLPEPGCGIGDRFQATFLTILGDHDVPPDKRREVVAHEIGHYFDLDHVTAPTPADDDRLMLPTTIIFGVPQVRLVQAEVAQARASIAATTDCRPLTLNVTGATRTGGVMSDQFIAHRSTNPADAVTVDAVMPPAQLALGTVTMTGGAPGANPLQNVLSRSVTSTQVITATFTPTAGGSATRRRVRVSVVNFTLDVVGATRVGGPASTTFQATQDAAAVVTVNARIDPLPRCIPFDLVTWSSGTETADPLRRTFSRAAVGRIVVTATLAGETRTVNIDIVTVAITANTPPFDATVAQVQIEGVLNSDTTLGSGTLALTDLVSTQPGSLFRARADVPGVAGATISATLRSTDAGGAVVESVAVTLTRTTGDRFVSLPILAIPTAIPRSEIAFLNTAASPKSLEVVRAKARGAIRLDVPAVPGANANVTVRGRVLHLAVQCFSGSGATVAMAQRQIGRANRIWAQAGVEVDARSVTASVPAPAGLNDLDHVTGGSGLTAEERRLVGLAPGGPSRSAIASDLNIYYVNLITGDAAGVTYGTPLVTDPTNTAIAIEAPVASDLALAHELGHVLLINWGTNEHNTQGTAAAPSAPWPASNIMHFEDTGTGGALDRTQVQNVIQSLALGLARHLALEP
jgi:outer membrane protein OmpA-like peptidoglycan-associated protein